MARKTEVLKIDGKEYTVRELIVSELLELSRVLEAGLTLDGIRQTADELLPKMAEGLTFDEALTMAPSDLAVIWEKFRAVNRPTFQAAKAVGADVVLQTIKAQVLKSFWELSAGQSRQGTETR